MRAHYATQIAMMHYTILVHVVMSEGIDHYKQLVEEREEDV